MNKFTFNSILRKFFPSKYGWFGNYESWKLAKCLSSGYDFDNIFKKSCEASEEVINGTAKYERDTKLFYKNEYNWPLLSNLMWLACLNKGSLNLIDFGGSLGSTYFQHISFFSNIKLNWNIIEQDSYVEYGKNNLQDHTLKFYNNLNQCYREKKSNIILLSSVLPYIEKPFDLLEDINKLDIEYILIDRTYFYEDQDDRLTIQKVSPTIYDASYPCWIFSQDKFLRSLENKFKIVNDFEAIGGKICIYNPKSYFISKGMLIKKI